MLRSPRVSAATGEVVQVYAGTENTCEIIYHDGRLVLSVATAPKTATDKAPPLKILALDAASGKRLWETGPFASLYNLGERGKENVLKQGHLMIAAAEDRVYCVTEEDLLAFDLRNGKPAWRVPRPPVIMPKGGDKTVRMAASNLIQNLGSLMVSAGRVYYAQPHASATRAANNVPMTLLCLAANTGKEQWRRECGDWSYTTSLNVYAVRGLIWVYDDPKKKKYDLLGLAPENRRNPGPARYRRGAHHHAPPSLLSQQGDRELLVDGQRGGRVRQLGKRHGAAPSLVARHVPVRRNACQRAAVRAAALVRLQSDDAGAGLLGLRPGFVAVGGACAFGGNAAGKRPCLFIRR